jgi:hypothetical protein
MAVMYLREIGCEDVKWIKLVQAGFTITNETLVP